MTVRTTRLGKGKRSFGSARPRRDTGVQAMTIGKAPFVEKGQRTHPPSEVRLGIGKPEKPRGAMQLRQKSAPKRKHAKT